MPIAGRLPVHVPGAAAGCWLLAGLGSRGLIHHALLGAALAAAVLHGDEERLPDHTRRLQPQLEDLLAPTKPRAPTKPAASAL